MNNNYSENTVNGYFAIVLSKESQDLLLKTFPPMHPKIFAHHVTVAYKPTEDIYKKLEKYLNSKIEIDVCGYAEDEKGQAVVAEADLLKDKVHHITISTNNVPPVYSNELIEKGYKAISPTLKLQGTFEFIKY